uniref:C2 domain-containing protein n=1 Tax=Anopheles culicifacies TaxID=139723 RepID=A0A182LWC6_9DIPT
MDNVLEENTQCLQNNKQDFLVSATVYKARHLQEFNCDTFVMVQNQHPDVMLRMFRPGHTSLDAVARFNTVHYMHQPSPSGPQSARCVKRCTTLPRSIHCNHTCPDRCGCIYAKLDYVLGIGTEPELVGNRLTTKHMHCKVHVYQGRIFAGFLDADKCNAKLSVLFESYEMALSTSYAEESDERPEAQRLLVHDIEQEESVSFLPTDVLSSTYNWANVREVIQKQVQSFNVTGKPAKRLSSENLELTWWTKFYNSQLSQRHHNGALKIYDKELENIEEFEGFKDWSGSYSLQRIKRQKKKAFVKQTYGAVKCQIQISSLVKPSTPQFIPNQPILPSVSNSVEIVVVVYVVQALNLSSRDIMSESDAYIVLSYGNRRVRDRAFYIPNQASPVFGRRFEMRGLLPRDQMLHLSVYDRDFASSDDLIGSTYIDIEDRFWSKHLPSFGLPSNFTSRGYNKWRHQLKPSELLLKLCEQHGIAKPRIKSNRIFVGGQEFDADLLDAHECPTEQLCLLALNNFQHVANGFPLTPEHVETRSLYHPKRGGIEQGKVQLWIELYEPNQPHPLPLDITPQPPKPYELRLIVWNTADVMLSERNIFGTEMSDIYVKCWLQEFTEAQYTDVHYRSLTGEGNFNWRMIFPFRYSPADGMLVLRRRKAFYEQFDTELKYPPVLTVQVWDNDSFSADDFLGTMDLNLAQLPFPANCADACKFSSSLSGTGTGSSKGGSVNLFTQRRVRGWFPAHGKRTSNIDVNDRDGGRVTLTGKIELELEILSQEDAAQNPVGVGRKPPQHLPEPLRPEVSFNWLRQPAKTFNKLLWPRVRKSFIWLGTVIVLCLLIYGLVVNVPTVFMYVLSTAGGAQYFT